MCGIFGYFDRSGASMDAPQLWDMGDSIRHRGPDDHGVYEGHGVAIGNRRLSIIDVEHGHQPFVSDDGQIGVVQNGEIFNFIELAEELARDGYPCKTHSDTEVLLRLYEREGIGFVSRLNGMFAVAIFDARKDALYLVRDRIGVKPLYLYDDGQRILFSSEIKSLLRAGIPRQMNHRALHQALTFNYVPPPKTFFQGVVHLMPGHYMMLGRNQQETHCWWDLSRMQPEEKSEAEWKEEFNALLEDAVRLRLRSDVPIGAFLSGGVDSSSVVGMMARHMDRPVKTFSIGFHEKAFDESVFAQEAATRFATEHTLEKVDSNMLDMWPHAVFYCDQPHGDVSFMPTFRLSYLASRHVKVVLTGDGADELFAGYSKYKDFFGDPMQSGLETEAFQRAYFKNISVFHPEHFDGLYDPGFKGSMEAVDGFHTVKPLFEKAAHMDRINQALYIDMMMLLPGNNLVKPDRMGMAVSLEARTPFLDYRMMEFAFRMPGHLKLSEAGETKYLYKAAVSELIGENLAYREKQMFTVPIGEWLKNQTAGIFPEMLLSERTMARRIFQPNVIRSMLRQHQSGEANFTREIRLLVAIELWHRIFIDENLTRAPSLQEVIV